MTERNFIQVIYHQAIYRNNYCYPPNYRFQDKNNQRQKTPGYFYKLLKPFQAVCLDVLFAFFIIKLINCYR